MLKAVYSDGQEFVHNGILPSDSAKVTRLELNGKVFLPVIDLATCSVKELEDVAAARVLDIIRANRSAWEFEPGVELIGRCVHQLVTEMTFPNLVKLEDL